MSGFFCILVVPNYSGDGVRRRLSRRPPRRCSASRSAVPSTARAAMTVVYSGWFSTRVSCLCCGVCTEMSPLYLWISRIWRLIRSGK